MNDMVPEKYAEYEGGEWKPWPEDATPPPVDFYSKRNWLRIVYCLANPHIHIHSLVTPQGYRWDCLHGWTGKIGSCH